MPQVFVQCEGSFSRSLNFDTCIKVSDIADSVGSIYGIPRKHQIILYRGRDISAREFDFEIDEGDQFRVLVGRLLGGKGGFGSLLRGQKGTSKKTVNLDACRDLQGRRLRHAKAVDRLKEWLDNKKKDDAIVDALGGDDKETFRSAVMLGASERVEDYKLSEDLIKQLTAKDMKDVVVEGLIAEEERLLNLKNNKRKIYETESSSSANKKSAFSNSSTTKKPAFSNFDDASLLGIENVSSSDESDDSNDESTNISMSCTVKNTVKI
eukprot:GHVL01038658.1.p1 GENE.GHVL01038658.1~~GHVL01038658.1.p1  ORF type:complete len:266 (+),score=66.41 GHVL01038658.1:49-846(+)